jgi:hypothetical protein
MFQKTISITLAFFLLLSSSGMAFNIHYCKGKIAAISSVFKIENSCEEQCVISKKKCCSAPVDHHKDCCNDNFLEASFDHAISSSISLDLEVLTILFVSYIISFSLEIFTNIHISDYTFDSNAPPLYKKYSQLIFYA